MAGEDTGKKADCQITAVCAVALRRWKTNLL